MQSYNYGHMSTSIDITLYKYNYIDNKLWTQIHNDIDFIDSGNESIIVSSSQMGFVLDKYYKSSINRINSTGIDFMHKEINIVFFLFKKLQEMSNLQLIKLTLNKDRKYTRIIEHNGGSRMIHFSFKSITATINLYDLYSDEELIIVNKILEELKVLEEGIPFSRMSADILHTALMFYMDTVEDSDDIGPDLIAMLLDIIEPKFLPDRSTLLIITDY